jgi:ubiquinone/menaquinone biosynthesis C-methylase UbiE
MLRNTDVKKANVILHDKTARFFDKENIELFNPFAQRNLEQRLIKAIYKCKKNDICCDLACGTGNLTEKLTPKFEQVVCLDISKEMIRKCKAKNLGSKIHFIVGDAENLPFRDNIFDLITMHAALHHLPAPSMALKEIYRALKNEFGVLYIDHEPNSINRRKFSEEVKKIIRLFGRKLNIKSKKLKPKNELLFPSDFRIADVHATRGFISTEIIKKLKIIGFREIKIAYHDNFSSYFFKLPAPLNMLSLIDNQIDKIPAFRNLASKISLYAVKNKL